MTAPPDEFARGTRAKARAVRHALTIVGAAALATCMGCSGAGITIERGIQNVRFAARAHPAGGTLDLIEIDARSIAAIDHWPWPRANYARLIDQLRRAGVASVAFDVDFSSRSRNGDDRAFAAALARMNGEVVLPTLRQTAGADNAGYIDALPIPELRANSMAAAVSILPDSDGLVRSAPVGMVTAGVPRPSLSAMIAGRAGSAGQNYPIDYAIDPASIARHSFIDVRDGRFARGELAGKHVLVGATAVEVGDRYAVPRFGVVPGVVIQAIAAETLMAGMPVRGGWIVPLLIGLAMGLPIMAVRSRYALGGLIVLSPLAMFALSLIAEGKAAIQFELVPALSALAIISAAAVGERAARAWQGRRLVDEPTGMPNRAALVRRTGSNAPVTIAAARIADYDKLLAALGSSGAAELVCRIRDRISVLDGGLTIYRVEDRVLAWEATTGFDQVNVYHDRLRRVMMVPVEVRGRHADVTLAVGVARGPAADCASVLANAALAAAQARNDGSGWHIHAEAEAEAVNQEISLLGELDQAIGAGEIEVLYQPKLDIASNRVTSVEALVRWQHPTRGLLRPDLFIPLAERSDRIAGLTLHVLARTIADLRSWSADGYPISGAVNISAKLLSSSEFLDEMATLIRRSEFDPERLTLEVTESAAMSNPAEAASALAAIKDLGVAVSMDDYGTGQSTLTYLRQLPLDELKLDRSFVQFAHQNRNDAVLVRSTIDLAHELGLKVVAEGVEDAECLAFLASVGCDMAQGYLISRPTTAAKIADFLRLPLLFAA